MLKICLPMKCLQKDQAITFMQCSLGVEEKGKEKYKKHKITWMRKRKRGEAKNKGAFDEE